MLEQEFQIIRQRLSEGKNAVWERTVEGRTYRRVFQPDNRLILLGGGYVAQAVSRFASQLEFRVVEVDDRPTFANSTCFPDAQEILCEAFPTAIEKLNVGANDFVCVLTRGHRYDADCLRTLLPRAFPAYLGMIGSHRRVRDLFLLLESEGFDRALMDKIHSPIGLPIGAVTPEEIGISICAELIASRSAQKGTKDELEQRNTDRRVINFLSGNASVRAVALVLDTKGSTPVKAGAIMAIDGLGECYGTIGGGCGEAEVTVQARKLLRTGGSAVVEVNMTNDVAEAEGMVCGGKMKILIETEISEK